MTVLEKLKPLKTEIINLYLDGMGTTKICEKYEVNHFYIYNLLKDAGVEIRRKHNNLENNFKKQIIELFDAGLSVNEISSQLNLPKTSVGRFLGKNGKDTSRYSCHREVPLKDSAEEIITWYQAGESCGSICKRYDVCESAILRLLWKFDIDTSFVPKWEYDREFFSKITTEEKSWALGIWYTDGNNDTGGIRLSMTDLDIVEKMKEILKFNGPIVLKKKPKEHHKQQYHIHLSGQGISTQLTNLGCPPAKSLILNFPSEDIVPRELQRHFIRGAIDGDGTVGSNYVGLSGASPMLLQFPDIVKSHIDVHFYHVSKINEKNGNICHDQRVTKRQDIPKFLHWIYDDATIAGDRKYNNALWWYSRSCDAGV